MLLNACYTWSATLWEWEKLQYDQVDRWCTFLAGVETLENTMRREPQVSQINSNTSKALFLSEQSCGMSSVLDPYGSDWVNRHIRQTFYCYIVRSMWHNWSFSYHESCPLKMKSQDRSLWVWVFWWSLFTSYEGSDNFLCWWPSFVTKQVWRGGKSGCRHLNSISDYLQSLSIPVWND